MAAFFLGNDLQVGDGGVQLRIPVDQTIAAVDQPVLMQAYEYFLYRVGKALVHGKALPRPVRGGSQSAELAGNVAAGVLFPIPDFFYELSAAQVVAGQALFIQLSLHHHLSGDAGMIGADLPECIVALHSMVANQGIHNAFLEAVAHMQAAGDIGRRDHDAIRCAVATGRKVAVFFPCVVPVTFNTGRLVGFLHGFAGLSP